MSLSGGTGRHQGGANGAAGDAKALQFIGTLAGVL